MCNYGTRGGGEGRGGEGRGVLKFLAKAKLRFQSIKTIGFYYYFLLVENLVYVI